MTVPGEISRYRRNCICRDVREVLAGIRALGLTRPGQTAAGLAGDFAVERGDIPAEPERGEPGRDLPPEIMAVLCANLDTLEPVEVRVATQIGIDTGRRPEDILALPCNCLDRDKDGAAVLVYDNAKGHRLGRRLPIGEATAKVIAAQQDRVQARFPHTPPAELALLPTPRRNPHGRTPVSIDMLDARHREWISALPALGTRDGIEVDKTKIVPYVYRHCYAQRHADAGVPIDVLAELLDHRSYSVTRRYYRIGEDRRRAAVDTVTALSFDRHGNRIWRDAHALLESERARHAVGTGYLLEDAVSAFRKKGKLCRAATKPQRSERSRHNSFSALPAPSPRMGLPSYRKAARSWCAPPTGPACHALIVMPPIECPAITARGPTGTATPCLTAPPPSR